MVRENYFSANIYSKYIVSDPAYKLKCKYCGRCIKKGDCIEVIQTGFITPIIFHDGHLIKFFEKQRREFLLSKI